MESKEFQKQRNICTMYKSYAKKSTSGITLIALVVTIIVLLILAGVSINLVLGENGIVTKAALAKEAQEMAQLKEEANLVKLAGMAGSESGLAGEYGKADLLEDLKNNFEGSTLGSDRITTADGKYDIIVDDDLNITVEKSGETENPETRKIIITSSVEEREGIEYIDLIFEVEGMLSFEEYYSNYIDEYIYPDKSTEELENKFIEFVNVENEADGIELITELTDTDRENIMNDGKNMFMTQTYEQSLKMTVLCISTIKENTEITSMQEAAELVAIRTIFNVGYNYTCDIYNEEKYEDSTDIENQILRVAKYDGDFESLMGATRQELEIEASKDGFDYGEFLRMIVISQGTAINVSVSNGESFTSTVLSMMDANLYSYKITQDGEYTFTAESMTGVLKGQTTVKVGTVPVTNPFEKDDWEVAWTCTDGTTWSEKITNDGTIELPSEGVIAKFYNTGNTITPEGPDGTVLESGPEYKLVIEGSGDIAPTVAYDFEAWGNTQYSYNTSEVIICNGIEKIGDYAFFNFASLKTIKIPDTVKSIGDSAFWNCWKLDSISIPEGITSIGASAFKDCSGITEIIIPDGITRIEQLVFSGCTGLTSIIIPENVIYIGDRAFNGCSGITEITIPDGVTEILYGTFTDCTSLASITIPDSVETIGHSVFEGCSELVSITLPSKISEIESYLFHDCVKLKEITIPANVTYIGGDAFNGCTALETVKMQYGVTSIWGEAFYNCTSLANISLPDSLTEIGLYAFKNCTALNSITIPSKVESISDSAFENCSNLKNVTILSTEIYYVGDSAFMGLSANSYIYVPNSKIQAKIVDGKNYDSTKTTISIK